MERGARKSGMTSTGRTQRVLVALPNATPLKWTPLDP